MEPGKTSSRAADPASESSGRLVAALRRKNRGRPPVWFMRQAGRYLPGYRELRSRYSFVEMCRRPELALEVSLEPYREFGLDAVIAFYDILFIPEAMGAALEYTDRGPVFHQAVREPADVRGLRVPDGNEGATPLLQTLEVLRENLPDDVAVLGFAGAPFTLAAYLVEGDFRRSGDRIRRLAHERPDLLEELLEKLSRATVRYVKAQAEAGADAVQLFDTWAGLLSAPDYARWALPYEKAALDALAEGDVPSVLYVNGCHHLLESMTRTGARALSIDWRVPLTEARRRVGDGHALQGNFDPATLFATSHEVRLRARELLSAMDGDPAWVFNLGHGVLPETPVETVRALVETVKGFGEGVA